MSKNILVVSDFHLNTTFDKKKFDYIYNLFNKYDQIVMNGDFWSCYSCTFDEFLKSKWNELFPLMLKKECIYIHGNHDRKLWCDERVNLFSILTSDSYTLDMQTYGVILEHGHLIVGDSITNETFMKIHRFLKIDKYNYALQDFLLKKLGREKYSYPGKYINKKFKEEVKRRQIEGRYLITSHSHAAEISLEDKYINVGFIRGGYASYILLNEKINLVKETY